MAAATTQCDQFMHFQSRDMSSKFVIALFVVIPVALGFVVSSAAFIFRPGVADDIGLSILPVPAWFFIGLWVVIYGGMGIAVWQLIREKIDASICVPAAILIAGILQTYLFWLSDSVRTVAMMDSIGLILSATTFWVFMQYSRRAALWLLPWVIWMPVTLALKIAALAGAFG